MGICNSCKYGINHICPERNVYKTVCKFKDESKKDNEVKNERMKIVRKKDMAICNDYEAGATIAELAAKYSYHRTTITNILKRNGVELRNSIKHVQHVHAESISEETIAAVEKELDKGTPYKAISKKFGVTMYRIKQIKKEWFLIKNHRNEDVITVVATPENIIKPDDTPSMSVVEPVVAVEVEPEVKHCIYYSGKTKPSKQFVPAEFNGELIWAAKINSLDDIFTVAEEIGAGSYEYEIKDGNLFALPSNQIVLSSGGLTINPSTVAQAVDASISQARTHAII